MAGGAAGAPMGQTTDQGFPAQQPSQASQYSNYGAQPNGAFYAGPMAGAPAYTPQVQMEVQAPPPGFGGQMGVDTSKMRIGAPPPQQAQEYQPPMQQYGGGYGQGYGSPFGGMGGMGGMYGPQPQYGYGGMGRQFMGGGMYGPRGFGPRGFGPRGFGGGFGGMYGPRGFGGTEGPYGGRPARDFGPQMTQMASPGVAGLQRAMSGGGFDPRSGFNSRMMSGDSDVVGADGWQA